MVVQPGPLRSCRDGILTSKAEWKMKISARARYRDESLVATLMDLPPLVALLSLGVLWLLSITGYGLLSIFIPRFRGLELLVGSGLATLYLALAFWMGLGERALRRQRLSGASDRYRLGALSSIEFEEAAGELFRLQGYLVTENKRPDREDGGVDFEIAKNGQTLLVQVKHKWNDVGIKDIRELWGIVAGEGADGGVFVTGGRFSQRALEFAHGKNLTLIDADAFLRLRAQFLPVSADAPEHHPLISEGFARHVAALTPPRCMKCGKKMVLLTWLNGLAVTDQYWGCSDYPACKSRQRVPPYLGEAAQLRSGISTFRERWEVAVTNRLRFRNPLRG